MKEGNLKKAIERVSPDYNKLQEFTQSVVSVEPRAPRLVAWNPAELMKAWGRVSEHLHWVGVRTETTEDSTWAKNTLDEMDTLLSSIWERMTSGQSGILHPSQMHPEVRDLWEEYKHGKINNKTVRFRLEYLRPQLRAKYAQQGAAADT
ncbi:MAG: hypothetical protein U5P41_02750 [Gammaproteobacteria bacterium]|nr:hypothetical protein [Gammaproteobacteria bacterium]